MRPLASVREHVELDGAEDDRIEHRHDLQDKSVVDSIPTHHSAARRGAARRGAALDFKITIPYHGIKLKYH